MKKRVLAILVAAAMASTMLIGCGSAAPKQQKKAVKQLLPKQKT